MKREREREERPEDEESISCTRKRMHTYVGIRRGGKKKEEERTVHGERKKRVKASIEKERVRETYRREETREKRKERKENFPGGHDGPGKRACHKRAAAFSLRTSNIFIFSAKMEHLKITGMLSRTTMRVGLIVREQMTGWIREISTRKSVAR